MHFNKGVHVHGNMNLMMKKEKTIPLKQTYT